MKAGSGLCIEHTRLLDFLFKMLVVLKGFPITSPDPVSLLESLIDRSPFFDHPWHGPAAIPITLSCRRCDKTVFYVGISEWIDIDGDAVTMVRKLVFPAQDWAAVKCRCIVGVHGAIVTPLKMFDSAHTVDGKADRKKLCENFHDFSRKPTMDNHLSRMDLVVITPIG